MLHLPAGVVKRQEPVGVQTFRPELAVEGLDERVVGRLAGPREVEHDVPLVGPQVEVAGDELRALVDADRLRIAVLPAHPFERGDDVLAIAAARRRATRSLVRGFGSFVSTGSGATTTAGTKAGGTSASTRLRAARRQVNSCCGVRPCRRATAQTVSSAA